MEKFAGGIIAAAIVVFALAMGIKMARDVIADNCELAGNFIRGDKVYKCVPQERWDSIQGKKNGRK